MAELQRIVDKVMVEAEAFKLELDQEEQAAFRADPESFMRQVLTREGFTPQNIGFGSLLDKLDDIDLAVTRWEHLITPGWHCHWVPRDY